MSLVNVNGQPLFPKIKEFAVFGTVYATVP